MEKNIANNAAIATTAAKAPTRKELLDAAAFIGTAATAEEKYNAAKAAHAATDSEYVREILAAYMNGNKKPLKVSNLVGVTAENGTAAEHYNAVMLNLWTSAIRYADANAATLAAADTELFKAWKEYLSLFPLAAPDSRDCERIGGFVRSTVTAILTAEKYTTASGKIAARSVTAIASDSPKAINGFTRSVERLIAERLLNFDGVLSRVAAREVRKANKEKRDAILAAAAPVQIVKKAEEKPTAPKKSTTKKSIAA